MTLLVQLTDTHIVEPGNLLYGKVDTAAHLARAVEQVNAMRPQPDLVLITGDLVEHPGPATYQHFSDLIEPLDVPSFVLPGNHDLPSEMVDHFKGSGKFPATAPLFQYVIDDFDFRIIALNSHFDDSELPFFGPRRQQWLDERLGESDKPTLIAIHHPPMTTGIEFIDMVGNQWFTGIGDIISRHSHVQLVICGHGHSDVIGRIGHVPVYMAGSIAHQLIATRGNDHAPAFDERPIPPVLHHWIGNSFVSGSHPWPSWVEESRIDKESGQDWETLKDHMRGAMR